MKRRAVAWDIDGTLIDSERLHHRALVETCRAFGVDLADLPEPSFQGVHMLDVWSRLRRQFPTGLDRDEWLAAIERLYLQSADTLAATPRARETMRALFARSVPQVCVSNSSRRVVDANIAALGVGGLIAFSISLDDVTAGKPDPEPYRRAANRLGLAPEEILAVEDSVAGAASARAAGLFVVRYDPAGARLGVGDLWIGDVSELMATLG